MSTRNHNILYFVCIRGISLPNSGKCLWKAQNTLAGRGFARLLLPKVLCRMGLRAAFPPNSTLFLAGVAHKAQKPPPLCELWRLGAERLPEESNSS